MKHTKTLLKTTGIIFGLFFGAIASFYIYVHIPNGFQLRQAKGPTILTDLKALAEQGVPINPDPYASSIYRPGDPLFEPVLAIQQGRSYDARKPLEKLVSEGNTDAMYWLAEMTYGLSVNTSRTGAELFIRAAELGNPYAALRLDEDNYECQLMMGLYCDKKWGELGRKILKERADRGDIKAAYALLPKYWNAAEEDHKELERIALEGIKQNYYPPLIHWMDLYISRHALPFYKENTPLTTEEKQLIGKLVLIAANNNYLPAATYINLREGMLSEETILKTLKRMIPLMGNARRVTGPEGFFLAKVKEDRKYVIQWAAWTMVTDAYEHDDYSKRNIGLYLYHLERNGINPLSEKEMAKARSLFDEYLKTSTPVIYIDELQPRYPGG